MSSKKVVKKVDTSKIKVASWIKPDRLIWVEIMDESMTFVVKYIPAIVADVDLAEKIVKLKYEGKEKGPEECYADRVLERSEHPQELEDLVSHERNPAGELIRLGGHRSPQRRRAAQVSGESLQQR